MIYLMLFGHKNPIGSSYTELHYTTYENNEKFRREEKLLKGENANI